LIVNLLIPSHANEVFNRLVEFDLELLTLEKGFLDVSLQRHCMGALIPTTLLPMMSKNIVAE